MAKNEDIRRLFKLYGVEWEEVAKGLNMPLLEFSRLINKRTISPLFRRRVVAQIERCARRSESFYAEYR